jgi:mgtE-like transporter
VAALLNGILASLAAAILTFSGLSLIGYPVAPLWRLALIALVGGLLAGIVLAIVVVTVAVIGFRRGMNPDDIVGPAVTTAGDVFGMAALFVATEIALSMG